MRIPTEEDIKKIEKLTDILNRGRFCNANEVTDLYNKYIRDGKSKVQATNCSSCIRQRVLALGSFLTAYRDRKGEI